MTNRISLMLVLGFVLMALASCHKNVTVSHQGDGDNDSLTEDENEKEESGDYDVDEHSDNSSDGDTESESEDDLELDPEFEIEPDDDLTIDPDPDWDRGLDSELREIEDPNPDLVAIHHQVVNYLSANEKFESIKTDEYGSLIITSDYRIFALDEHRNIVWSLDPQRVGADFFSSLRIWASNNILAADGHGLLYVIANPYYFEQPIDTVIFVLDRQSGEILSKYFVMDLVDAPTECRYDYDPASVYGAIAISGDWLVLDGRDLCEMKQSDNGYAFYEYGISLLDMKLKWRWRGSHPLRVAPAHLTALPDGSFAGTYDGRTLVGDHYRNDFAAFRLTPFGETIYEKFFSYAEDQLTDAGDTLSNGTFVFNSSAGVIALSPQGDKLWEIPIGASNLSIDKDDTVLVTAGNHIAHYAPNGDLIYVTGAFLGDWNEYLAFVATAPASWTSRWIAIGESPTFGVSFIQEHTPISGQPELLPNAVTCDTAKNSATVIQHVQALKEAETEDWALRRVKDDSNYSCPLKPDIVNPFDSWATNAWSDATLDTVWIGGYDALWRYTTSTREALCLKIGNVEVITGHVNQGATTLAYVMDGQLFIGSADGSVTTSHALPEDIGVILSLAIDADSIAIGGPKGLWVRALTTETWMKIESCCGAGLQVNQSGLSLDGGTLWAGAFGGVWRIDPVTTNCTPQCLATEPYSIFEIYGRSPRGVWVAWQSDQSQGQQPAYQGNTVGECLDNGVWFPQLTIPNGEWILTGSKTTEGLLALKIKTKNRSPDPELPDCVSEVEIQTLPSPIGRSAPLTIPVGGACGFGTCCLPSNLGEKMIRTKNGYFASGLWMEALRKQSAP